MPTPKKKYNPLSKEENMNMLTLNNFDEGLKMFALKVYCFQHF